MATREQENFRALKDVAQRHGATSFGVASVPAMVAALGEPPMVETAAFPYAISVGYRLSDAVMETIVDGPTRLYAHHYRMANAELDRIAMALTTKIQQMGHRALPIPASQIVDWEGQRGHLGHKWVAHYAGLGWFGRHNLIVDPQFGARMRYVTVLTDLPLPTGQPPSDACGDCRTCIETCPAHAVGETRAAFDLARCAEQLRAFRADRNVGHFICGVCIKACPGKRT